MERVGGVRDGFIGTRLAPRPETAAGLASWWPARGVVALIPAAAAGGGVLCLPGPMGRGGWEEGGGGGRRPDGARLHRAGG